MNAIDMLNSVERTNSRKEKEEILKGADELTRTLLLYALDPYKTYGLQNIQAPTSASTSNPEEDEFARMVVDGLAVGEVLLNTYSMQLLLILQELQYRKLVGNEARLLVSQFLKELPGPVAKWFYRVFVKDLSCGITEKTVNKVFPGLIPTFDVQLAEDASGTTPKLSFPVWCDFKLDGLRLIAIKEKGHVTLYSRKGHAIDVLPSIQQAIAASEKDSFMLDGEVMGDSWNESQSVVFSTKNKVDDSTMTYNVFDGMPLEEWKEQKNKTKYSQRRDYALSVIRGIPDKVRIVEGCAVESQSELEKFYERAVSLGYEGIMVKDMNAPYAFKRSKAVLKMKPFSTWEGVIVGFELGDPKGKWAGRFGAFRVRFQEGCPITSVGGGFTDAQRNKFTEELAQDPLKYNGSIVEVKGQEITKDSIIRFPVFVRFRSEKDV